ncbi:hypothetical protein PG997_010164 [Apiospora hydei]|uniref:Tyrosinase copper-binding domain-containing protein n=1 Tax=Apiospora hydei TaxID=1337664 RepID=A0ABR1VYT7_9PEZI
MRISLAAVIALLATGVTGAPTVDEGKDADAIMDQIQSEAMGALVKAEKSTPRRQGSECSVGNAHIRRDWEKLGQQEKLDYIRAVQCLADTPPKLTQYGWANKNRLTINLGPITPRMDGLSPVGSIFEWNPRCLRRDLTMAASRNLNAENLLNLTVGHASHNVQLFQDELQGTRPDPPFLGMHGSGHFSMGADGTDIYASINDPAFWLHHAMLDRVYWAWQALHPAKKGKIAGGTVMREPDSPPAELSDLLDVMGLDNNKPIEDLLDTLGGTPLCYIYG